MRWETFEVRPLSPKTGIRNGAYVHYGHPAALVADNQRCVVFGPDSDKRVWAASDKVEAWEQFTFVRVI